MKNNNYYYRQIANNTGSDISKMKNDIYYLRAIASNLGIDVSGKLKTRNHYLKLISEHTENYDDRIALLCDKSIIQKDEVVNIDTVVIVDGKLVEDARVDFYVE